jgi:galactokinase
VPVQPLGDTPFPADWTFVIASSGVQADKADSVKERYNRAADGVRALHAIWNTHAAAPARSLAAALDTSAEAAEFLASRIEATPDGKFTVADLRRRLQHFIRETARAPHAARAFRDGDHHAVGALAADSQREADELLGNQIPETVLLSQLARDHGAFASSSFGAGFGGSVWALVPASEAAAFGERWTSAYENAMPRIGRVAWFAARPGPAASEIVS